MNRKKYLVIDGSKFPLPRRISDKFFREDSYPKLVQNVNENTGEIKQSYIRQTCRTSLSLQVGRFARDRYLQAFIDRIRAYSEKVGDSSFYESCKKVCEDTETSLEDRAQFAQKLYLQHLKKQKYG